VAHIADQLGVSRTLAYLLRDRARLLGRLHTPFATGD